MHRSYEDITKLIDKPPLWYDENAVPRYEPFSPTMMGIYINACGLFEIRCQSCFRPFAVGMSWERHTAYHVMLYSAKKVQGTADDEAKMVFTMPKPDEWHFGDPPRHGDDHCAAGDTMNSILTRVIEFYERDHGDWVRRSDLEVDLEFDAEDYYNGH